MKILVLNGSPKKEKSDTMAITRQFVSGMNSELDNEVETINLYDCDIKFCKGCLSCMRNGGTCILEDDITIIFNKILQSDFVIFSFPLYTFAMPAVVKAVVERMLPIYSIAMKKVDDHYEHYPQKNISNIRFAMISGGGYPNVNKNFDAAELQFKTFFIHSAETLCIPEAIIFNKPDFNKTVKPILSDIFEAGMEFYNTGKISEDLREKCQRPPIKPNVYVKSLNYEQFLIDNIDHKGE